MGRKFLELNIFSISVEFFEQLWYFWHCNNETISSSWYYNPFSLSVQNWLELADYGNLNNNEIQMKRNSNKIIQISNNKIGVTMNLT